MNTSRTFVDIAINGQNITADISGDVTSFIYNDNAAEEADDISLVVQNRTGKWMADWLPKTGDTLWARIVTQNQGGELNCRDFTIDEISFSGWPMIMNLRALAMPMSAEFSGVHKNRTWSEATMSEIAQSAAGSIPLEYLASYDPAIQFESQTQKSSKKYLHDLCQKHGLTLKTYNNKVVVYDMQETEASESALTLTAAQMTGFSCKSSIANTGYGSCTVRYTTRDGDTLEYTESAENAQTEKEYQYDTVVDSLGEAQRVARAKLHDVNLEETTFSCTMPGNPGIVSGICVILSGFGDFDGKYFIDKTTHAVSGGYTTSWEGHRVN